MENKINFFMPYSLMMAVGATVMGTDLYLAGMPQMVEQLGSTSKMVQWTITASVLGGGVSTPLLGPISDLYGRYLLLVVMQFLTGLAALLCGLSESVEMVIAMRFLFGFMGAGASVLTFAMLAEAFERRIAAKYMAYMTSIITFSLIIAPLLGGVIVEVYNWRGCFYVLGAINIATGFLVYLTGVETLKVRKTLHIQTIIHIYKNVFSDSIYLRLALIPALMLGGLMLYLSNAPFYFITVKGLEPNMFGIQQSVVMGANFIASFIAGRLMEKLGVRKITKIGLYLMAIGVIIGIFGSHYSDSMLLLGFIGFSGSLGLCFSGYTSLSLERHQNEIGTASAVNAFLRAVLIAVGTGSASQFYDDTLEPTMMVLSCIALLNVIMYLGCYKFIQPKTL